jgi:hypothetical protein
VISCRQREASFERSKSVQQLKFKTMLEIPDAGEYNDGGLMAPCKNKFTPQA